MLPSHTWTGAERRATAEFARSLSETRLDCARKLLHLPSASADELVCRLREDREQLSRLFRVFGVTKPDIVRFFRQLKPSEHVLSQSQLRSQSKEVLGAWLLSYFTQVC